MSVNGSFIQEMAIWNDKMVGRRSPETKDARYNQLMPSFDNICATLCKPFMFDALFFIL